MEQMNSYESMKSDLQKGLTLVWFLSLFGLFGFKAFKIAWMIVFGIVVFICFIICFYVFMYQINPHRGNDCTAGYMTNTEYHYPVCH